MPTLFILSFQSTLPLSEWQERAASSPVFCLYVNAAEMLPLFNNRSGDKETRVLGAKLK